MAQSTNARPKGIRQTPARECSPEKIVVPSFADKKCTALDPRVARVERYPGATTIRQQTEAMSST